MNTITKLPADFCEGRETIIPAEHPNAARPIWVGVDADAPEVPYMLHKSPSASSLLRHAATILQDRAAEYAKQASELLSMAEKLGNM